MTGPVLCAVLPKICLRKFDEFELRIVEFRDSGIVIPKFLNSLIF
jgi:hypothetical protein